MIKLGIKYYVLCITGMVSLFFAYYILHTTYYIPTTFAQQGSECQLDTSVNARATGLISASNPIIGTFTNQDGKCVIDPKASFISFKLPKYAELKSTHFDQAKDNPSLLINKNPSITPATFATEADITIGLSEDQLYHINGNLTLSGNPSGSRTGVIFVDGALDINANLTYGTANSGLVFVVGGDVNITSSVTTVNAVIISQGNIFTAGAGCTKNSITTGALTINGSLISLRESLSSTNKIIFCRNLLDNSTAAEVINHQSKYVVILRDIFSSVLKKWTEIAGVPYIPVQLPTPTVMPTATPTPGNIAFKGATSNRGLSVTSFTLTKPPGVVADDVMIAQITNNGFRSITPPSGWNLIRTDSAGFQARLYWKAASTSEPTSYTWTFNTITEATGGILAYSEVDPITPIDANGGRIEMPSEIISSITAPSITTTIANDMLIFFAHVNEVNLIAPPAGMSERYEITSSNIVSEAADEKFTGPGATGERNAAIGGTVAAIIGQLIALAPANTTPLDSDGDGVSDGNDCNASDPDIYQTVSNLKKDEDQDNYTVGVVTQQCVGSSMTISGRTYYKDAGGLFSWLAGPGVGTDCYDKNANALPEQTSYFTTNRGDGSFDYNCSGTIQLDPLSACTTSFTSTSTCQGSPFNGENGFVGTLPSCGQSAPFRQCQAFDGFSCIGPSGAPFCRDLSQPGSGCPFPGPASWRIIETTIIMGCH